MTGVSGGGLVAMALLGAGIGAALFGVLVRLVPPRTSLVVQLGRYDALRDRTRPRTGPVTTADVERAIAAMLATPMTKERIERDRERTEKRIERESD